MSYLPVHCSNCKKEGNYEDYYFFAEDNGTIFAHCNKCHEKLKAEENEKTTSKTNKEASHLLHQLKCTLSYTEYLRELAEEEGEDYLEASAEQIIGWLESSINELDSLEGD